MLKSNVFDKLISSKEFLTPLYLYDAEKIKENIALLRMALPSGSKLFFSMKANPSLGICQLIGAEGCGVEVASAGELYIARQGGIPAGKILFTSPGKTKEELEYAIESEIKLINVDSLDEIKLINEIAKERNRQVDIGIRVNPAVSFSNAKIKMSGVSSQFGIEEEMLDSELWKAVAACPYVNLVGFQVYMGTQMLSAFDIVMNVEYIIKLVLKLKADFCLKIQYINFGGGFGVPYFKNEEALDLLCLKKETGRLFEQYSDALSGVEAIFESGRYIMAEAGYFITKVISVKQSKGMKYVICDGGSNCHSSAAFLGRFVRNNFPMYVYPDSGHKEICTITGPLCTPLDVLGQKVEVKKDVKPGDYVVIEKSGAYGLTYSPNAFLSHATPAELLMDKGEIKVLRQRGTVEQYMSGQKKLNDAIM